MKLLRRIVYRVRGAWSGCRLDSDPAEQAKILKEYGVDKPVDHVWVYR